MTRTQRAAKTIGFRAGRLSRIVTYNLIMAIVGGWALMLAVGVIHADWLQGVPTIGYIPAVLVVFLLNLVASAIRPSDYSMRDLMSDDDEDLP